MTEFNLTRIAEDVLKPSESVFAYPRHIPRNKVTTWTIFRVHTSRRQWTFCLQTDHHHFDQVGRFLKSFEHPLR